MNIDRQIEFDKVKEIWAEFAVTDWAKERIREAALYFSETELKKQLRDTTDARELLFYPKKGATVLGIAIWPGLFHCCCAVASFFVWESP